MDVALLTVGDEILAGDTTNTNAAWLANEITTRGATVRRILTVPDDHDTIARWTRQFREEYDAVVVTGGLGGTPDDVTMVAVADGLGRERELFEDVRDGLLAKSEAFRDANPDLASEYEFDMDFEDSASLPAGARPLVTDAGWAPGCAVDGVYVLPGIPDEMKAMFELVADEFDGDTDSRTLYTPTPEGAMGDVLTEVREKFDTEVGSYPADPDTPNRLKVVGEDEAEIERTVAWLRERVETVPEPE
ncbi:competence/damage-inducible protein A [Halosegnis longus]|uniref:Competence/damage-inducible protein A n=1 Tax=Halosegnis longus TaxID=2216012 RepID=A0AAJ4R8C9_9EURY|nr:MULTISPECIES: molybdopterin-binding protein [Halobacteriales]RNJ26353.1 competence/damage-inducible protein A [Salella cibi]